MTYDLLYDIHEYYEKHPAALIIPSRFLLTCCKSQEDQWFHLILSRDFFVSSFFSRHIPARALLLHHLVLSSGIKAPNWLMFVRVFDLL